MTSRNRRITQAKDVKRRAKASPPQGPESCFAPGCQRLTQRSAGKGLSETYCHRHIRHLRSHGHLTRKSYSKAELEPFRQVAAKWIKDHHRDPEVREAIARLQSLMSIQNRSKDAYHHRSMIPKAKARNVLARLHEAGKTGEQLLGIALTVKATHAELGPWDSADWYHVQIAKQAKKLRGASGTRTGLYRQPMKYPRGEGIFMRLLGQWIDERAACAADRDTIDDIRRQARGGIAQPAPQRSKSRPPVDDITEELKRIDALRNLLGGGITIETL